VELTDQELSHLAGALFYRLNDVLKWKTSIREKSLEWQGANETHLQLVNLQNRLGREIEKRMGLSE
jgi:hypothetical protein